MAYFVVEKIKYWDSNNEDYSVEILTLCLRDNYGEALEVVKCDINKYGYTWNPSNHADPFFRSNSGREFAYRILQLPKKSKFWTFAQHREGCKNPIQVYDPVQVKHNLVSCGIV